MGISFISPESVNHLLHIFLHKYIDSLPFNVNQGQGDLQDGEYLQHFREPWHELNQVVVCQLSEHLGCRQIRSFYLVFKMLEQFVIYFQKINVKYGELRNCFKRLIFYHTLKDHISKVCECLLSFVSKSHLDFFYKLVASFVIIGLH